MVGNPIHQEINTMSRMSRRQFITSTSAFAGASLLLCGTGASGKVLGANDRLRIAVAGLKGRGGSHIEGWLEQPNVELAYLVDPDQNEVARRLKEVQDKVGPTCTTKGISDIREALDDKNVDAISIATPNHWHSLMTIWGAQAGKHVYVEKPMSHDIAEGRIAVEAQKKYGVVIQHGTQQRSNAEVAALTKAIHEGKFGRLKISYGYCCKPRAGIGFKSVEEAPANLDWNLWRGPATFEEYHANLVHYNWHWFWKSGNGDMNNQGTHQLDRAFWAIDPDQTHPVRAMSLGGRFNWDDQGETPNTMFGMAEYPNGQQVFFNVRNVNYKDYQHQVKNEYYFEDGGRILDDKTYIPAGATEGIPLDLEPGGVTPGGNWGAFVAACRAGDPNMANGNVMAAHTGSVLGHLMNNSYRIGEKVPLNLKAGKFGDNKDAYEHFAKLHEIVTKGMGVPEDGAEYTVGPWLTFDPETERCTGEHAEAANALLKDPNREGFEIPDISKV
jgi:predicted dehydrogenase